MITSSISEARQQILESDTVDYHLAQLIMRFHPVGHVLVNMPIDKAIAAGRDITIQAAPQMAIDRFIEVFSQYNGDKLAGDLLASAKAYGISSLIVGQYDTETQSPLNLSTLSENSFINVIDPLNMAGSGQRNQNPNQRTFLQAPSLVKVQGIDYHSSRCFTLYNPFENPLYLQFNSASFSYAPSSVYERVLYYLQLLLENDIALETGNKKVGAIVHKKAFAGQSTLDAANQSIKGFIKQKISSLFNGDATIIGKDDEITTVDLMHFSEALTATREAILDSIAMASSDGIPAAMLKGAMLGRGMSEGDNDKKKENECIIKHQLALTHIYKFIDTPIQRIAWNDADFYKAIQSRHPEYKNVSHRAAISQWSNSFKWEWNPIDLPNEVERVEIAEKKAALSAGLFTLAAQMQLPENALMDLFQTHVENINDSADLANKFYFDPDMIKLQELEERLLGGNDDEPQIEEQAI